jgi:hypothetical protein
MSVLVRSLALTVAWAATVATAQSPTILRNATLIDGTILHSG